MKLFDLHTDLLSCDNRTVTPDVLGPVGDLCCACFCGALRDAAVMKESVQKQARLFDLLPGMGYKPRLHMALEGLDYVTDEGLLDAFLQQHPALYAGLTWNYKNALGGSCFDDGALTPLGKRVIRVLERRGVAVDLAHAGKRLFYDVFDCTEKPIVTHACLSSVCPHPRNLDSDQLRLLISRGSLLGITLYSPFSGGTCESVMRNVTEVLAAGGAGSLAIGTDYDGCGELPLHLESYSGFEALFTSLRKTGMTAAEEEAMQSRNCCDFFGLSYPQ